ncbi:traf2 and NCK-interacting protein kinase-like [Xenopus laevis]|uniref:Traf2 and NCK-interacting protein kinase-like n=1 Tax=Xenopus laevis TaxID=8355 RepID=A0A8J1KTV6_XENLA|nr:traf2 and NCK-interacting protein kinase-like [Xenopus laevis]
MSCKPSKILELGDFVGGGACAKVYKGHHLETNDTVAIKVLSKKMNTNEEINREIQILKNYSKHENIVSFYGEYSETMGEVWIAMEYCGGGSIKDLITNTPTRTLPETWIAYIIREVLKALKYLHKNLVVHRDLKGVNIALTEDASVRLIDFGLSKKLEGRFDSFEEPVGTPYYFAPEMWKCIFSNASYGCKCDIWSLGITAIVMAEGMDTLGLFCGLRSNPPTLRVKSKWSTEFNSFLGLCLKKNPEVRGSAEQLLKHPFVRDLQNVEMVRAEIQSQIYRVKKAKSEKEQSKRKSVAAIKAFHRNNLRVSNAKNLNPEDHTSSAIVEGLLEEEVEPEAKKDATDSKELASQADIESANTEEPVSKGKNEASDADKLAQQTEDASCNGEEKITKCNKEISDAAKLGSQAEDNSDTDEELFLDALEQLFNSDFTRKTETAASTEDQVMEILKTPNEAKEEGQRKAEEVIYKAMAIFYLLSFAVFLSGFAFGFLK